MPNDRKPTIDIDDLLCFDVYSVHHAFNQVYKSLLDPLGLTYPQYLVLVALWSGGGQTVGQIGQRLGLESNTLTPLVKRLEKNGLVTRSRDPEDERRVLVALTPEGEALRGQVAHVPNCIAEATGLSEVDFRTLHRALATLRKSLLGRRDA